VPACGHPPERDCLQCWSLDDVEYLRIVHGEPLPWNRHAP
jgi:hypothetical protein